MHCPDLEWQNVQRRLDGVIMIHEDIYSASSLDSVLKIITTRGRKLEERCIVRDEVNMFWEAGIEQSV